MTLKNRDFQRIVRDVKCFLTKLSNNDASAEVRDALNFLLLHLHKYFKKTYNQNKSGSILDNSLSLSTSFGSLSPVSPFHQLRDKFDWQWINLDAAKLSVSFGQGDLSNLLPEVFYVLKDGDVEKLNELIAIDKDCVNEVDALGRSTIFYCIQGSDDAHLQCLKVLLENNVDLLHEANDGFTCIHMAAITNNLEALKTILQRTKQLNVCAEDNEGRQPLHYAAGYGSNDLCKLLIDLGGDRNCVDNDEMTPLMWACYFDQQAVIEMLLNVSEDESKISEAIETEVQDQDIKGRSMLHWCVMKPDNINCFRMLFSAQYVHLVDEDGKSILHTISENGAFEALVEYLRLCSGNVQLDSQDSSGCTPLHLASMCGHGQVVDLLLNKGASLHLEDDNGHTALHYAQSKNLHYCMLVMMYHQKYRDKLVQSEEKECKNASDDSDNEDSDAEESEEEEAIENMNRGSMNRRYFQRDSLDYDDEIKRTNKIAFEDSNVAATKRQNETDNVGKPTLSETLVSHGNSSEHNLGKLRDGITEKERSFNLAVPQTANSGEMLDEEPSVMSVFDIPENDVSHLESSTEEESSEMSSEDGELKKMAVCAASDGEMLIDVDGSADDDEEWEMKKEVNMVRNADVIDADPCKDLHETQQKYDVFPANDTLRPANLTKKPPSKNHAVLQPIARYANVTAPMPVHPPLLRPSSKMASEVGETLPSNMPAISHSKHRNTRSMTSSSALLPTNILGQSWPPVHGRMTNKDETKTAPRKPRSGRSLAPISPNLPR